MDDLSYLIRLTCITFPQHRLVMCQYPPEDDIWVSLYDPRIDEKKRVRGRDVFRVTSDKSILDAMQAVFSWACHYKETGKVINFDEFVLIKRD